MTPPVAAIFDGEKEAKLIALACSEPPKGRARHQRVIGIVRPRAGSSRRRPTAPS